MSNILDLLDPFKGTVDKILGIVDKFIPDPAAKVAAAAAIQAEADAHVEKLKALDAQVAVADDAVTQASLASTDKFVSRSSASLAYIAGLVTVSMIVALIFQVKLDTGAVATLLTPLWLHAGVHTYYNMKES